MNKKSKYFVIFIAFITPLAVDYISSSEFSKYIYLIIPSLLFTIYIKVNDLEESIRKDLSFLKDIGNSGYATEIREITKSLLNVKTKNDVILDNIIKNKLFDTKYFLSQTKNGIYPIIDEHNLARIPIEMMDGVQHELLATLLWREDTLLKGVGSAYTTSMIDAIKNRNVSITRLFIINEDDIENDNNLKKRMNQDIELGVDVRFIFESEFKKPEIDIIGSTDLAIWDNKRVWIYNNINTDGRRSAMIYNNPDMIKSYKSLFRTNWKISKKII